MFSLSLSSFNGRESKVARVARHTSRTSRQRPSIMTLRFGVLWCEDSSKWAGQWCMYQKALGRADASEKSELALQEEWEVFDVCAGQLPSIESIIQYTGMPVDTYSMR